MLKIRKRGKRYFYFDILLKVGLSRRVFFPAGVYFFLESLDEEREM